MMRSTTIKSIAGWTLIELLLVLICVSSLTVILVYAFAGRIQQQDNSVMVVANVEDLVAAAHNWRLNQSTYTQYTGMPSLGILSARGYTAPNWVKSRGGWLRNGTGTYLIAPFNGGKSFKITISNIQHPCYAVTALGATYPLGGILPATLKKDCQSNPDTTNTDIGLVYD